MYGKVLEEYYELEAIHSMYVCYALESKRERGEEREREREREREGEGGRERERERE